MNRIAVVTIAGCLIAACDSTTAPLTCSEDPSQPTCRVQEVGAAYVTPTGTVNLVSLDGSRWAAWNAESGSFGVAADVAALEGGGLPLSRLSATATSRNNQDTFMFDGAGTSYTIYEHTPDEFDEVGVFGPSNDLGSPDLIDVGAITRAANTNRLFFFDQSGTLMQLFDLVAKTWTPVANFQAEFGGGGAPIANVGAAVYVGGVYYLFDTTGKTWATYLGNFQFEGPFDISELGDGTLDFR